MADRFLWVPLIGGSFRAVNAAAVTMIEPIGSHARLWGRFDSDDVSYLDTPQRVGSVLFGLDYRDQKGHHVDMEELTERAEQQLGYRRRRGRS